MNDANLERLKSQVEPMYKKIGSVYCPYLKTEISFNRLGLTHLKFKKEKEARNRNDQYIRLKHLKFAPRILEKSSTLQELRREKTFIRTKSRSKREFRQKWVIYYGFVAIINDSGTEKRLKIIVRHVDGGKPCFWSIVPFWSRNKDLKLFSGNLSLD